MSPHNGADCTAHTRRRLLRASALPGATVTTWEAL